MSELAIELVESSKGVVDIGPTRTQVIAYKDGDCVLYKPLASKFDNIDDAKFGGVDALVVSVNVCISRLWRFLRFASWRPNITWSTSTGDCFEGMSAAGTSE